MSDPIAGNVPNGLASLAQKRARRAMPPPRHPARMPLPPSGTGGGVEPQSEVAVVAVEGPVRTHREVPAVAADAVPAAPATVPVAPAPPVPARPATVYLDEPQVQFLEQARVAGLLSSPRLDLSKSAVVRLALRRLQEQMSVDEICVLLRAQPSDPSRAGRKKR